MLQEIRYALRSVAKTPGFAVVAILTVALAIGANTAVFSLINALLIRPLPYRAAQELCLLWERFPDMGLDRIPVSAPEYNDYEKQVRSFDKIAAFNYADFNLAAGGMPERIQGAVVTPSLFPLLGIEPVNGRAFAADEWGEGHDDVVVISARLWQRRFNSDSAVVGNKLLLNGRSFTVIGVMPASFQFPIPLFNVQGGSFAGPVDIWKPIAFTKDELSSRGSRSYGVIGRLRKGVSATQAQAEFDAITAQWKKDYADNYDGTSSFGAKVYPLHDQVIGSMRPALLMLLGSVALVLLIACANLATMLLARAGAREREFAIRVALGAGPMRVLRQVLTESVILAVAGGVAGTLLAIWGLGLLRAFGAQTVPRIAEVNLDSVVLAVTLVVSVCTGIIFGIAPALASAKPEMTSALKEGGRGSTSGLRRNRLRNALVVTEIAFALVLLVGAGLLLKSFARLQQVDPGFNPKNVLTAELALPPLKYPRGKPVIDFYNELYRRVKALPGVEAAAFTTILPLSGTNSDSSFAIEGMDRMQMKVPPDEEIRDVTPEYFQVLQTPLLHGRVFNESDTADAPLVATINQALAHKYFGETDAVGKRITQSDPTKPGAKWVTIVGVVSDIRHRGLDEDAKPEYYLPHTQQPSRAMTLAVRSTQDPRGLTNSIRAALRELDPEQPMANVRTFEQVASDSLAPRKLSVVLLAVFAGVALLLAAIGIYGVMSFLVVQRTHEIGVRMALGAQRSDVLRLVVGHGLKLLAIGSAIGLIMAAAGTPLLSALLYNVRAFDLTTFAIVAGTLAVVALLASYIPARRATRADPMLALGHGA